MTQQPFSLLLCTNGTKTTYPAIEYGAWLAQTLQADVTLLGIVERPSRRAQVESALRHGQTHLDSAGVPFRSQVQEGESARVISEQAESDNYLTILGPMGSPLWFRWLRGSSFRRTLQAATTPLVYVRRLHKKLERILICMGGLGYAASAEQVALYLANRTSATLTLLHVVEPITYDYPTAVKVQEGWDRLLETDTPQGKNLRQALAEAEAAGVPADVRIRQGNVVREILAEVQGHDYDLVAMGSPYSAESLRHLFGPNVTAEVAEAVDCPVLTVRHRRD